MTESNNPYFRMLWNWFESRGAIPREAYHEGLTPSDFKTMLDEHETALIASRIDGETGSKEQK